MTNGDYSARFNQNLERPDAARSGESRPLDHAESYRLRARMIGVLLRDARLNAGRSLENVAELVGVPVEAVEAWEFGDSVPSLPQIEILAYYLGVPVSHFWGGQTLEAERLKHAHAQTEFLALRDRMIGALLRQARLEMGLSLETLAAQTGLSVEHLEQVELGEQPLPMHELTVLAGAVQKNIRYFLESSSYIGEWLSLREDMKHFAELPEDIRRFAANPVNVGFMEIAYMLSQMPADRLRRIGETVLNITM